VPRLIGLADQVWAGNAYLADYARRFNQHVEVVPTTVDTDRQRRQPRGAADGAVCLGWTGSPSTIKHFELVVPILLRLRERFGDRIAFRVIGDGSYRNDQLGVAGLPWREETEIADLSAIDVGLMPLPDDEWAKGKCGLKALQFMAMELPVVTSPVGVNTEIVQDGNNGFLAQSEDEWFERLSALIESARLRRDVGSAARRTVVERYSVISQRERYLALLGGLVSA
jgi:glycosyltransferase involved in cell wall biosynthesis